MRTRVLTALAGIPLVVAIVVLDSVWLFSSFIGILTLIALHEYFRMAFPDHGWVRLSGIVAGMLREGYLILGGGPAGSVLSLTPPFAISELEIRESVGVLEKVGKQ